MRPLCIAALALCVATVSYAQRFSFKFYGEEQGLTNLGVQTILQDRQGFLWVGTQNGLFRYDGRQFRFYGQGDGLPGTRIEALHEAQDGTLWVGTDTGLARRSGDRFRTINLRVARGIVGRSGITSDRNGVIYLATENGLVAGSGNDFTIVAGDSRQYGVSVYRDSKGIIWGAAGMSLYQIDRTGAHPAPGEESLPKEEWYGLIEDQKGNFWVRSETSLYVKFPNGKSFSSYSQGLPPSLNTQPTLALDSSGDLLVPTQQGLGRLTSTGWEIIGRSQGITGSDVAAVFQDHEGSVWLGLLGSGLARWLGYQEWESWTETEGLERESVWSILQEPAGRIWLGTQSGLSHSVAGGRRINWREQPLKNMEKVRAMALAPGGSIWIGGEPGGLIEVRDGAARVIAHSGAPGADSVLKIAFDHGGRAWIASRGGLFRSTERSLLEFQIEKPPGTTTNELFSSVLVDRKGRVWATGSKGLVVYQNGAWTRYTTRDGLRSNVITHLTEDPREDAVWLGYREGFGITKANIADSRLAVHHISRQDGLMSDRTVFIGFDRRNWQWVGTDHGVDMFDGSSWRHYGRSQGLIWDDCNQNGFLADIDGSVWIATSRGLSRFHPAPAPAPMIPPPVVFTSVGIGGRSVDANSTLVAPFDQNSLRVNFSALSFVQEAAVLYRYRMVPIDRDWVDTTNGELDYPTLPPGSYTLEVLARNGRGVWSEQPAKLSIEINPPWWQTIWFRLAGIAAMLLAAKALAHGRARNTRLERERLEAAVEDRTRELQMEKARVVEEKTRAERDKAIVQQQKREIENLLEAAKQASRLKGEFLANVSHEIRTPMNGILGMTDLVLSTDLTLEQREFLDTAKTSAESLLALLNDILDFSKIEADRMDLNPVQFALEECVRSAEKALELRATEKHLTLRCHIAPDVPNRVIGDPVRLRQVLVNLLANAIKFTDEGHVLIKVHCESLTGIDAVVRISISDTGIGVAAEKREMIFEAFRQADGSTSRRYGGTGLGLAICAKLVPLLGGKLWMESEVDVGSTFHFTAKFGLPTTPAGAPTPHRTPVVAAKAARSLHVLLAEDNVVNQRLVLRLLERRGHTVQVAGNGREALALLDQNYFNIILMDVQMPEMDGIEATSIIRQREKGSGGHTPIVAITAHAMKGDRERCLAAGMDAYVNKPIEPVSLVEVVESSAE